MTRRLQQHGPLCLALVMLSALVGCVASDTLGDEGDTGDERPRPRSDSGREDDDTFEGDDDARGADVRADAGSEDAGACSSGITCSATADCREASFTTYVCSVDGCCEPGEPAGPSCARHLDACDQESQSNDNFVCDVDAGVCLQRCNLEQTDAEQGANCPARSFCFDAGLDDPPLSSDDIVLDGVCVQGDCDSDIFDLDACGGGTCLPVANGASFCVNAGTASEGEACGQSDADEPPADDICETGLLCFRGQCVAPCELGAGTCDGGQSCLDVFDTTTTNRPGLCASACEPFASGDCSTGEACAPSFGRWGINAWMCAPIPGTPAAVGQPCDLDAWGNFANCAEGSLCLPDDSGRGVCVQMCDPSGEAPGEFAECDGAFVCPSSSIDGLGFCRDACDPYPRRADDGCAADETCAPFVPVEDVPSDPLGYCTQDEGGAATGGSCANEGYLGNGNCPLTDPDCGCADLNVCLAPTEGARAVCASLCEPFSTVASQCGADSCSAVPPLLGNMALSFCVDPANPGSAFDECDDPGFPCAEDGTLCLEFTDGTAACLPICRDGFDDCDGYAGTSCDAGTFNDPVPAYMGVCL